MYYEENNHYADDIKYLKEYSNNSVNSDWLDISVSDSGKNEFYTITKFVTNENRGFALQGNSNGVFGSCDYQYGCTNNTWDVTQAIQENEDQANKLFPIPLDGSAAVGKKLSQGPQPPPACGENLFPRSPHLLQS